MSLMTDSRLASLMTLSWTRVQPFLSPLSKQVSKLERSKRAPADRDLVTTTTTALRGTLYDERRSPYRHSLWTAAR